MTIMPADTMADTSITPAPSTGNLFAGLPQQTEPEERFERLLAQPGLRIERIVSTGQASPPGFWYEQEDAEWVCLLAGAAGLQFADESGQHELRPGDWRYIAPRRRHRVAWTDAAGPTVWLAIHIAAE